MADLALPRPPTRTGESRQRVRVAHVTTVDMSLALLLAGELRADVEAGLDVIGVSAPGPYVAQVEELGVSHVAVPSFSRAWRPRADVRAAGELAAALRRVKPDVVHTHTPKAGVLGRLAARALGVPVIVNTCHGLWAGQARHPGVRAVATAAEAVAAWASDVELYQNDADRQTLRWVTPAWWARTVGNGVPLDRFRPDPVGRARVRAELGVGDDEILVGGVGRRVAEKGIAEFAVAAEALSDRARFVWIGPADPDKPDHLDAAGDHVDLLGARDDMPAVYSALDVFVLPSYREGFSRSAMEAAACGAAMVLSDVRGCREIGAEGTHVRLVPAGDADSFTTAVASLIDAPSERRRLAHAALVRARTSFDQQRVAGQSVATYRDVALRHSSER